MSKYNYHIRGVRIREAHSRQANVKEKKTWTNFLSTEKYKRKGNIGENRVRRKDTKISLAIERVYGLDLCGSGHDRSRLKEGKKFLFYTDGQYSDRRYYYWLPKQDSSQPI